MHKPSELYDETVSYQVVYHDPAVLRRAGEKFRWVTFTGRDYRAGARVSTDTWDSADYAEAAFLDDKEKAGMEYRVLKVRTTVEIVRVPRAD
ncbi:hypothetical protein [Micromonospora avicenniae]|uniref:hypothetical protein n=1 Tax=Micromonospora avicenniae TaxID=1198245 RepID=UPI0033184D6E